MILDTYLHGTVERISPEAPVPVLRYQRETDVAGGAANVAINISSLGGRCCLIGVTGQDEAASRLGDKLAAMNVTNSMVAVGDRPTTIKQRIMSSKHQQMLRIDREVTTPIDAGTETRVIAAVAQALDGADALVLSDYAKGCLTQRVLGECISLARARGVPILVDPKRRDFMAYAGATFIKPNLSELAQATGMDCKTDEGARAAARSLTETVRSSILLTRSERGICLYGADGTEEESLPTEAREVFDVSGAGDTVLAAFALAIAAGTATRLAMRIANAAAGIVVGKSGTATVTRAELRAALTAHGRRVPEPRSLIMSWDDARMQVAEWKRQGLSVGFTNGCFDLVHPGHVAILTGAAQTCDRLVVGLNSDASVKRLKGPTRPIQAESARAAVMAAIGVVDGVVLFDQDTPLELISTLLPDVLVKGQDYAEEDIVGGDVVKAAGGRVERIRIVEGHSTTSLVANANLSRGALA
ncbi:MAG: D-glycero-beta-D-manno-heptose 1-phosphate adenylyltransferase [Rhodobacteraceae bacterium]|nr:D-glycero-beta-D-manno-heptose 1-phosphate adenylyltransferase [Paracoccaceae bacterium]